MIFKEYLRSDKNKWKYEVEDIFGKISILSPTKLDGPTLDQLAVATIQNNKKSLIINNVYEISYEPRVNWEEDNAEEAGQA